MPEKKKKSELILDENLEKEVQKKNDFKLQPILGKLFRKSGYMNYVRNQRNKKQDEMNKILEE